MPNSPPRPCPACKRIHCTTHTASPSLYTYRWQQLRKRFLQQHVLCERCHPRITVATVVDHRNPHKGNLELFWNTANLSALCKACHDAKTATEDGGFGR